MATAKQAAAKNLCVVTGTQRHHQRSYVESYKKIMEGLIGEITAVRFTGIRICFGIGIVNRNGTIANI